MVRQGRHLFPPLKGVFPQEKFAVKACMARLRMAEGTSAPHFRHQNLGAENLHHSFKVIGEDVETHFRADPFEGLCQEVGTAHP